MKQFEDWFRYGRGSYVFKYEPFISNQSYTMTVSQLLLEWGITTWH